MGTLTDVLRQLAQWDGAALELTHEAHWGPLTTAFVVASAWWVKWPLIALVGAFADVRSRRGIPLAALCATGAAMLAETAAVLLKELTDRARPPFADPSVEAIIALPESASFPSGHAAAAFAAAAAVGLLHPRLRAPLLLLAATVALSRVYLGVHFWSDVLAGGLLGAAIGLAVAWTAPRLERSARVGRASTA